MRRLWRAAALGALFVFSLIPFEAKATAATLVTGVDLVFTQIPLSGDGMARRGVLPRHRPARLARLCVSRPAPRAASRLASPLPDLSLLGARLPQARARSLDGHRRYLGRERAPPA